MTDHNWRTYAACREVDPEAFYPTEMNLTAAHYAISICHGCDVRLECLTFAMQEEEKAYGGRHGIRGGLTPTQRTSLAKGKPVRPVPEVAPNPRRKVAECGTDNGYKRHWRTLGEPACEACKQAHREARAAQVKAKKESAA